MMAWEEILVRRFQLAAFVEAASLLEEHIATAGDIDNALRAGAGLAVGPLEWADQVGLDTVLAELEALVADGREDMMAPSSLRRLVSQGRLGRRVGRGYRVYESAHE